MKQYIIDASTTEPFHGGPAAVCLMDRWLPEDPVCGRGHCHVVPIWAEKLGQTGLTAYQASARGGTLYCRYAGDRTYLSGDAVLFAESEIHLP